MSKNGLVDTEDWERLKEVRREIDALSDEKEMLVQKIYNLVQKFVQEVELQNSEQRKHIASQ
jgi:hypothetical protein